MIKIIRSLKWATIGIFLVFSIIPFTLLVFTSFKTNTEAQFVFPPTIFPKQWYWGNYPYVFNLQPFGRYFFNSLFIASFSVLITLMAACLAAYVFARYRFPGRKALMIFLLMAQMFPGAAVVIPTFDIINKLGMLNKHTTLVMLYATFAISFSCWMLYCFFRTIPASIEEAAIIDGCSRLGVLTQVVLPLSLPAIFGIGVFSFLVAWNDFLYAFLIIADNQKYTLPLGMAKYVTEFGVVWSQLAVAAVIATIPVFVLYALAGKSLIAGLTAGAVKE